MRDPSDRLREIDERARQTQAKINQINFDRSVRAAERGDERRRQQKEFEKFAAGEPLRRTESSDDGAASTDDYPRWVGRIIITGGCPGAAASIWAMIVSTGIACLCGDHRPGIGCRLDCSHAHGLGDHVFVLVFEAAHRDRDSGCNNPSDPTSRGLT
jgi:hypothetical protein